MFFIALQTLREELRRKTFYLFLLFPPVCIFTATVFTPFTPGSEKAFVTDIALSTISFFVMLVTAFITCDIFSREVKQGTAYWYHTNPIGRLDYVLGKYLGCLAFLTYGIALMAAFTTGVIAVKFHQFDFNILKAILLLLGEFIVLMGFGVFSSTFLSKFTNFLFVIIIYLLGHLTEYRDYFEEHFGDSVGLMIVRILFKLFPDLNQYEVRDWVVMGVDIETWRILEAYGYALLVAFLTTLLSVWVLRRRTYT